MDGLQNYRHMHFENESPALIANILVNNRKLVNQGKATLTDVMVVNNKMLFAPDTDLKFASIQRVIDLDTAGTLRNAAGDRYNTIIFAHCRSDFSLADVPLYMTSYPSLPGLTRGTIKVPITKTTLSRHLGSEPFSVQREEIGEMMFFPMSSLAKENATLSSLV